MTVDRDDNQFLKLWDRMTDVIPPDTRRVVIEDSKRIWLADARELTYAAILGFLQAGGPFPTTLEDALNYARINFEGYFDILILTVSEYRNNYIR